MKAHIGPTFAAARAKPLIGFLVEQQAFALLLEGPLISPEMRRSMARQLQGRPQARILRINHSGHLHAHGRDGERQLILAGPAVGDGDRAAGNGGGELAYPRRHSTPCFVTAEIMWDFDDC